MLPNDRAFNGKESFEAGGKVFYRTHKIERQGKFRLKLRVVAINSDYRQGIAFGFSLSPAFSGTLFINGEKFIPEKRKHLNYVIPVSVPEKAEIIMDLDIGQGHLHLANASDFLDDWPALAEKISAQAGRARGQFRGSSFTSGFTAAPLYGNAFWIEQLSEAYFRFHCNDHKMDDDFDDLIFDMEIIPQ